MHFFMFLEIKDIKYERKSIERCYGLWKPNTIKLFIIINIIARRSFFFFCLFV